MNLIKIFTGVSLLLFVSFQSINRENQRQYLSGVVLDKQTGEPLPGVYVYTVKGEEEGITNQQGKFRFSTWQAATLVLHVKHSNYDEVQVKVNDLKKTVIIRI